MRAEARKARTVVEDAIGISKISRESSVRETSQQVKVNAIVYNMSERLQNRMSE